MAMRSNGSIQVQDPSASPTFALSRGNNALPDVPPALRRNLFSSHLSRRPPNASTDRMPDPFQPLSVHEEQESDILQRSPRHHQTVPTTFTSRRTPSRSQSPIKSQSHTNPHASIIAVDPKTGRPQLPKMPLIPTKMPEDDEDDQDQGEEELEEVPAASDDDSELYIHKRYPTYNPTHIEPEISSSSIGLSVEGVRFYELMDQSASHIDLSKVQSILSEMQSQQKSRARTTILPDQNSSTLQGIIINSGVSARTRGKAKAVVKPQMENFRPYDSASKPRLGGIGATLDPNDKEELLSAIMAGLSKRIQEAEENAWMFGDERININGLSAPGGYSFGIKDELDVGY